MRKKIIFIAIIVLVSTLLVAGYFIFFSSEKAEAPTSPSTSEPDTTKGSNAQTPAPEPALKKPNTPAPLNKQKYSLDEPSSLWAVINKQRPLPSTYSPSDLTNANGGLLRSEASSALEQLLSASSNNGVPMSIISSYRSYSTQQSTYNGWVARDGQAQADTYSARPGHSEHQTGLAVDLGNGTCNLEICFGNTPAGQWLAKNAHSYGFIIRYQNGKQAITGYQYEPWHLRYLGKELAAEIYKSGQTMEEFFGLPAAPSY